LKSLGKNKCDVISEVFLFELLTEDSSQLHFLFRQFMEEKIKQRQFVRTISGVKLVYQSYHTKCGLQGTPVKKS